MTERSSDWRLRLCSQRKAWVWVEVLLLLLLAMGIDFATGPLISASAFYVLPIALAGWLLGPGAGLLAVGVSSGLNLVVDGLGSGLLLPRPVLWTNEGLLLALFLIVMELSVIVGRVQKFLIAERDEMADLSLRFEQEMRDAGSIQRALYDRRPVHPGAEIETFLRPSRILAGDAVNLSLHQENCLAITLADVSGKGSPAALAGAVLIGLLEDAPERYRSPAQVLRHLNRQLEEHLPGDMFVTLFYALLDLNTGSLVYANAGHDPPFLFRDLGNAEELSSTGIPLGMLPDSDFEEKRLTLTPGDLLFCYTDGLVDCGHLTQNPLGPDRLREMVDTKAHLSCRDLILELAEEAIGEVDETWDDIAMVAVRFHGSP